jgi:hypothetical protein
MRHLQSTLSCQDVCRFATDILLSAFGMIWVASGGVSPRTLVYLLVRAGAERRSLDAIARMAQNLPSAETIRQALRRLLPRTSVEFEPAIREALHRRLPKALSRRPRTMAIDYHKKPYYGSKNTPGICCSQVKASTTRFFVYATLLVIRKGRTFTVGLVPVVPGEEKTTIITRLLQQAAAKGLKPRCLLLDRGFYGAKVIGHLQQQNIPFVIPVIRRGQVGTAQNPGTGTAQFFRKGRRGWATYLWKARLRIGGHRAPRTPVTNDVCMAFRGKDRCPWVYACYRMSAWDPKAIAQLYRRRFRIETSYRQMHEGLAQTSSKNLVYRLLLVLVALVLRNLWVWLHLMLLAQTGKGKRVLSLKRMRARTMMHWLVRYLDDRLEIPTALLVLNPDGAAA